jgi:hypothetical protein
MRVVLSVARQAFDDASMAQIIPVTAHAALKLAGFKAPLAAKPAVVVSALPFACLGRVGNLRPWKEVHSLLLLVLVCRRHCRQRADSADCLRETSSSCSKVLCAGRLCSPWTPAWYPYCRSIHGSYFDARSGYFEAADGGWYFCQ